MRYETKGIELIQDADGTVTGVFAQKTGSEKYIKINAKAIIIATGDYLGNEDMMKFYTPQCVETAFKFCPSTWTPWATSPTSVRATRWAHGLVPTLSSGTLLSFTTWVAALAPTAVALLATTATCG